MTNKEKVCFLLTKQDHEDIKKIAEREHRSVSNLISVWIAEHKEG